VLLHYLRNSIISLKCSVLYHCFASFKQSPLDFFKLVGLRLILLLSYVSLNLIISGVQFINQIWAVRVIGQKK